MTAREELRLEFEDLRALLRTRPRIFIVLTEPSMRGLHDPFISKMERTRGKFWREQLSGIIRRGIEQGVFRRGINVQRTATALMAQFKGIGYDAMLGKRTRAEVDQVITEIARLVEHWLTCRSV